MLQTFEVLRRYLGKIVSRKWRATWIHPTFRIFIYFRHYMTY
jgi:hypothetical protein